MQAVIKRDWPVLIAFVKVFAMAGSVRTMLHLLGLFGFTLAKRVLGKKGFIRSFPLELRTKYGGTSIVVRDMADITTVAAIFAQDEYASSIFPEKVKTILDLGSNIGGSVANFRR